MPRVTAARTDVNNLMQALKLYRLDNQRYPSAEQGLQALVAKPTVGAIPANWKPYLDKLPNDPWGHAYQYVESGREGRDRCLQLGRGRTARRRWQERGHRLLAVAQQAATLRRGRRRARRSAGFTLIELMIVVALIALASGIASLALRDPASAQLEQEAVRLSALLEAARAEARAAGVPVRWQLTEPVPTPAKARRLSLRRPAGRCALPRRWAGCTRASARDRRRRARCSSGPSRDRAQRIVLRLDDQQARARDRRPGPFSRRRRTAQPDAAARLRARRARLHADRGAGRAGRSSPSRSAPASRPPAR